jgi:hypothetical protein
MKKMELETCYQPYKTRGTRERPGEAGEEKNITSRKAGLTLNTYNFKLCNHSGPFLLRVLLFAAGCQ